MTIRYKSLKEIPQYPAGTIFTYIETPVDEKSYGSDGWHYLDGEVTLRFTSSEMRDLMYVLLNLNRRLV